jgi:putative DNA primase/helicase
VYHQTDAGNALFFARFYQDKLRFDHVQKRWLIWKGSWWQPDKDGAVIRLALNAIKQRRQLAEQITDYKEKSAEFKWTLQSEQHSRLSAMVAIASNLIPLADSGQEWDAINYLLGAANGVVDLRSGKMVEPAPGQKIAAHVNVTYNPQVVSELWQRVVSDILGPLDMIEYFQTAIGYSATGETREQCLFMIYGDGANGKSTLVDSISRVLVPYSYTMPFSTIEFASRSSISNDVAELVGKRFVVASETQENIRLNEGRIKSLTGDQTITARFLHKNNFTFHPQAKYWLCFNHKPRSADDTLGFWRRVRLISLGGPIPEDRQDKNLAIKLAAEAPGILNWIVQGAMKWYEHGLQSPQWVVEETARYRVEQDVLREFFEDCIVVDDDAKVLNTDIWQAYLNWVRVVGERFPLGRKSFSQRLVARGFKQESWGEANQRIWLGLRLVGHEEPSSSEQFRAGKPN